jgi:replicative DNA helicase
LRHRAHFAQIKRHAPSLRVVVYDGLRAVEDDAAGADQQQQKKKAKRSYKKMSREQRFTAAQVLGLLQYCMLLGFGRWSCACRRS